MQPSCTLDEYLRAEDAAELRHEFVAGGVFVMAGFSERHNLVRSNVAMRLRIALRGSRCAVFIAGMKLHIARTDSVYYPDVMLVCDPEDAHSHVKTAPCVIVEVLSMKTSRACPTPRADPFVV